MAFCDATAGTGATFRTDRNGQTNRRMEPDGQTDVEVEIVI